MPMPTSLARLDAFQTELHACFTCHADALFELPRRVGELAASSGKSGSTCPAEPRLAATSGWYR